MTKLEVLMLVLVIIIVGFLAILWQNPLPPDTRPNTKERCESQGGKAIFVGYSGSWNCEFSKEGGEK